MDQREETPELRNSQSSSDLSRREFFDVLAKTAVVTSVVSFVAYAGGCGSGNNNSQYT